MNVSSQKVWRIIVRQTSPWWTIWNNWLPQKILFFEFSFASFYLIRTEFENPILKPKWKKVDKKMIIWRWAKINDPKNTKGLWKKLPTSFSNFRLIFFSNRKQMVVLSVRHLKNLKSIQYWTLQHQRNLQNKAGSCKNHRRDITAPKTLLLLCKLPFSKI